MIYTTLNAIRAHSPCKESWEKLLAGLGKKKADDEPLPFATIVEICGIEDALWATSAAPEHEKEWRLFAVWCARKASKHSDDWRVVHAVQIVERYAHGMASKEQLDAASDAASDAARAAWGDAASDAAGAAAWAAASDAARAAAWAAARAAAWDAARAAQKAKFLEVVS